MKAEESGERLKEAQEHLWLDPQLVSQLPADIRKGGCSWNRSHPPSAHCASSSAVSFYSLFSPCVSAVSGLSRVTHLWRPVGPRDPESDVVPAAPPRSACGLSLLSGHQVNPYAGLYLICYTMQLQTKEMISFSTHLFVYSSRNHSNNLKT